MGNSNIAPPPVDYKVEKCMKTFGVPIDKIEILWKTFLRYDREKKGLMTMQDFFQLVINFRPSVLTDSMLRLIETKNDNVIEFGEFVELICTFACFEQMELLKYLFYILDSSRTGLVKKNELKFFFVSMWYHENVGAMREAFQYLDQIDESGNGVYNFEQILYLKSKFPGIFYPLYNLQTQIRSSTFGETWWANQRAKFYDEKAEQAQKEKELREKQDRDAAKADEMLNEAMLKRRMGVRYYVMPWERETERKRLLRIAAIQNDLDSNIKAN